MTRIILAMALVACDPHSGKTAPEGATDRDPYQLIVSRDEKNGVTCYRVLAHDGLSCLRDAPDGGR